MKRQELIAFTRGSSRRLLRLLLVALGFFLVWMLVLIWSGGTIFDRIGITSFLVIAAIPLVVLFAAVAKFFYGLPKCPHCGIKLVGPLLIAVIASGNCGSCGQRVVED